MIDYSVLPVWARDSLHEHRGDARDHVYTLQELEEGRCVLCVVCLLFICLVVSFGIRSLICS